MINQSLLIIFVLNVILRWKGYLIVSDLPKKKTLKKWKVVEYLFENGFEYEHFYDFENEKYLKIPENIYEAKEFIENYKLSEN